MSVDGGDSVAAIFEQLRRPGMDILEQFVLVGVGKRYVVENVVLVICFRTM